MTRHVIAAAGDIKPGEKKLVTVKGREIGVFNVGGEYYALANRCPHAGGPMCEGMISSLVVPRTGYDVRETTLRAFDDAGVAPRFAVQGGEMDAVLRLVEAGTGVAVVPDLVFAGRPGLRRTVLSPPLYRTVALARRADLAPSHAMRAFQDTLLAFLAEPSRELPGDVQVLGLAEGPM